MNLPSLIKKLGDQKMRLEWPDGTTGELDARMLRLHCQCASCKHELTGEALIREDDIPKDVRIKKSAIVGNYALSFEFSDGHSTGIYSFDYLKHLLQGS